MKVCDRIEGDLDVPGTSQGSDADDDGEDDADSDTHHLSGMVHKYRVAL